MPPNNSFKPKTNRCAIVFGLIQALAAMTILKVILATLLIAFTTEALAAAGKGEIAQAIASAKTVALLSLEPGEAGSRDSDGECAGYCYFGWPVLGQTTASPAAAKSIRKALSAWAAAPAPNAVAMCFNPRHGVRVQANGHTYDFVVCFECEQTQVFKDSASDPIATFYYKGRQADWDTMLSAANVPLATPADSDGS